MNILLTLHAQNLCLNLQKTEFEMVMYINRNLGVGGVFTTCLTLTSKTTLQPNTQGKHTTNGQLVTLVTVITSHDLKDQKNMIFLIFMILSRSPGSGGSRPIYSQYNNIWYIWPTISKYDIHMSRSIEDIAVSKCDICYRHLLYFSVFVLL